MGEESTLDGEHIPTTVMKWGGLRGLSSLCCRWVSRRDSLIRNVHLIAGIKKLHH